MDKTEQQLRVEGAKTRRGEGKRFEKRPFPLINSPDLDVLLPGFLSIPIFVQLDSNRRRPLHCVILVYVHNVIVFGLHLHLLFSGWL